MNMRVGYFERSSVAVETSTTNCKVLIMDPDTSYALASLLHNIEQLPLHVMAPNHRELLLNLRKESFT